MARSVTCNKVNRRGAKVYIRWSDGDELEFNNLQDAKDFCQPLADDPDLLKRLFIAAFLLRNPDGSNVAIIEGRTMTLDLTAANLAQLLRVT